MCAISGIIGFNNHLIDIMELTKMSDRMTLRGPDSGGVFVDGNVGLAHRRLSIIDLSTGN